jgi:hypothetical protein
VHAFPILHLVGSPESDLHAPPYSLSIRQRTRQHFRDCWPCQHRSHIVAPCRLRVPSGRDAPPEVSSSLCRQDSRRYYILRARLSHVAKPYEQMFLGFTLLYRLSCHGVDRFSDVSRNIEHFTGIPSWQYLTPHDTRTAEMFVKAARP